MGSIIAKLGGRTFIVALVGLAVVMVTALTGFQISDDLKQTVITAIAGIVGAHSIARGAADGLSGGATSSKPPEVK